MSSHDDICARVARDLESFNYGEFEVFREHRPSPIAMRRADVMAFTRYTRRPALIIEVKPKLMTNSEVGAAVRQVEDYVRLAECESPHAKILPLIIAGQIGKRVDGIEFVRRALVWDLRMFKWACSRLRFDVESDAFQDFRPDGIGRIPVTFGQDVRFNRPPVRIQNPFGAVAS